MRPCRFSRPEFHLHAAMQAQQAACGHVRSLGSFGLHVNFHSINVNLGTYENALAPKKWGRREYFIFCRPGMTTAPYKSKFMAELAALTMAAKVIEAMQIKTAIIATDSSEAVRQLHTNQGTF